MVLYLNGDLFFRFKKVYQKSQNLEKEGLFPFFLLLLSSKALFFGFGFTLRSISLNRRTLQNRRLEDASNLTKHAMRTGGAKLYSSYEKQ